MPTRPAFDKTLFVAPDPDLEKREKRSKAIKVIVVAVALILFLVAGYHLLVAPVLK